MAVIGTERTWGLACTCTGGTSAAEPIVGRGANIAISAIVCGGAATTDIVTVYDGSGNLFWQGCSVVNSTENITFGNNPPRLDGLKVGCAGATTGWVNIIFASR